MFSLLVAASTTVVDAIAHEEHDNLTIATVATAILAFAKCCFRFF